MVEMVALVFARLGDTPLDEAHSPHEDANPLQAAVPGLEGAYHSCRLAIAFTSVHAWPCGSPAGMECCHSHLASALTSARYADPG